MKQLIVFFSLTYIISWATWFPLYAPVFGITNLPVLPFHHGIGALGPLIASILTTGLFLKKEGLKILLAKCFQLRPLLYLAIALFSPFFLAFIAAVINYFINNIPVNLSGILSTEEFPAFSFPAIFIYNLVFFGFGEEVGWRGFALPRLQSKLNALSASVLLTVFWAAWHIPLFFYRPGYTTMEMSGVFGWIFSLLTGSILITWLYNSSRGSILICAIFHSTIDIAFTGNNSDKNIPGYMGMLITIWGVLTILVFKPKNLAKKEREKLIFRK